MSIRLLLSHKKFPHADDLYWTFFISMFLLFFVLSLHTSFATFIFRGHSGRVGIFFQS